MDMNLGLDPMRIVSKSGLELGSRPTAGAGTRGHEQHLAVAMTKAAPGAGAKGHELHLDRIQKRGPLQEH